MFDRRRRRSAPDIADDIRQTISRLDEQRRLAAAAAGRALVNQAEVTRVCHEQLRTLMAASEVAEGADSLARRAADSAGPDAADLEAYQRASAGLQTVRAALGAAAQPIHELLASAGENVEQARRVLDRARVVLDEQIREQVRLLIALEAAERARIVAEARRRPS